MFLLLQERLPVYCTTARPDIAKVKTVADCVMSP